jgi:predicted 2-oxoglutarate/Fe(II)-dependent dioxygenase YbiX
MVKINSFFKTDSAIRDPYERAVVVKLKNSPSASADVADAEAAFSTPWVNMYVAVRRCWSEQLLELELEVVNFDNISRF